MTTQVVKLRQRLGNTKLAGLLSPTIEHEFTFHASRFTSSVPCCMFMPQMN